MSAAACRVYGENKRADKYYPCSIDKKIQKIAMAASHWLYQLYDPAPGNARNSCYCRGYERTIEQFLEKYHGETRKDHIGEEMIKLVCKIPRYGK